MMSKNVEKKYFAGIDIGASATKAVIIDEAKKIVGSHVCRSGADLAGSAQAAYDEALKQAGLKAGDVGLLAATGFGRNNFPAAHCTITEISCHSLGSFHYFPKAITIIDIGGQDNKLIHVDQNGCIMNFKMNRKCAAGTGAFLEEVAYKMDIPLEKLNGLARQSIQDVSLGSFCTVFTGTEILTKIREGKKKEDIIRGAFCSVARRIIEMDPLIGAVVLTGGVVAHNNILAEILGSVINKKVLVPPSPQLIGALGAALLVSAKKKQK